MTTMKRKDYEKPTMKVVKLQQQTALLQASKGTPTVKDYNWNEYEDE